MGNAASAEKPLKVLLAESSPAVRGSMEQVLRHQGYEVICASDGFDVLCRLPEWRPDLLLMACSLPRLTGSQVCSLLRQSPDFRHLRVILLADDNTLLDRVTSAVVSADACLVKPFRTAELQAALLAMPSADELATAV